MDERAGRGNRIGLALTGIALIAAGAETLARGTGGYGPAAADRPVPGHVVADYLTGGAVNQVAAAGPGIALALVGLGWLLSQVHAIVIRTRQSRPERDADVRFARAVVDAFAADIRDYPGVHRARCRLFGPGKRPWLSISVGCGDDADLPALRKRLDVDAPNVRESIGLSRLPVVIRFRVLTPRLESESTKDTEKTENIEKTEKTGKTENTVGAETAHRPAAGDTSGLAVAEATGLAVAETSDLDAEATAHAAEAFDRPDGGADGGADGELVHIDGELDRADDEQLRVDDEQLRVDDEQPAPPDGVYPPGQTGEVSTEVATIVVPEPRSPDVPDPRPPGIPEPRPPDAPVRPPEVDDWVEGPRWYPGGQH